MRHIKYEIDCPGALHHIIEREIERNFASKKDEGHQRCLSFSWLPMGRRLMDSPIVFSIQKVIMKNNMNIK